MPGVGKTYWGQQLSAAFNMPVYDLDEVISAKEGRSVEAIFEENGEPYFRECEHACLSKLITDVESRLLVSTGGGTPCYHNNMALMKQAGKVVYLEADISYLLANIERNNPERPLLKGSDDVTEVLTNMLEERKRFYLQADYILQAGDISLANFEKIIEHV